MVKEFKLPELGENITSADVLTVLIKAGDTIEKDQTVIEIETDKATIEVPSTVVGVIKEVLVKQGDKINVGAVLFTIDTPSSDEPGSKISAKESVPASSPSENQIIEFKLPELGENIESADVLNVMVKVGEMIARDQGVIEIETDKATIEVPSTVEGKVIGINIKPGDKAKVGSVILKVESLISNVKKESVPSKLPDETHLPFKPVGGSSAGEKKMEPGEIDNQPPILKHSAPAAPSVRRIAREL